MKGTAPIMRYLSVIFFLVLCAGCRDDGASYKFDDAHGVQIDASAASLIIRNSTLDTVYYFAVERETATRIDWIPRSDSTNAVKFNSLLVVPYTKVTGYTPKCQILVYLWNGTRSTPFLVRSGSMRSLIVQTP
jgi:hypothetical protein